MKYLLAFAVIAVATAMPEPVRLLEPVAVQVADISPLTVPQEVMDEVTLKVKFVDAPEAPETPVAVDAPVEAEASEFAVNFVNEAVNAEAPEVNDASAFAVNFVDEAVNVDAPVAIDAQAAEPVKIVDAPVETNDDSAFAVNIVHEAVNFDAPAVEALQSPIQIKIIDIPLPESVVLPLVAFNIPLDVSNPDSVVNFVDVADADEETPFYMPIKLYPNPMLR